MSVEKLLQELGITYRVIDDEAFAKCPFHYPDRHPSWSVNLKSGVHYCFSCGAKGNLAYLISTVAGVPYTNAVIKANDAVGHAVMDKWREDYEHISLSPMSIKVTDADLALFTDPPPEALTDKNVTLDACRHHGIMWNPEHQTWIFPYRDPYSHELWGWQEKNNRIFRNYPAGTKKSKTLFGYDVMIKHATAVLLESPIDCAVLYSAGLWGVASFGMPNLHQLVLLQLQSSSIIFALDNDKAGISETRNLIPEAMQLFDNVRVMNYSEVTAKDPGDMTYDEINNSLCYAVPAIKWMRENNESN